jgi:hypothetical protein
MAAKVAPPVPRSLTTFDMFPPRSVGSVSGQAPLSQSDSRAAIPVGGLFRSGERWTNGSPGADRPPQSPGSAWSNVTLAASRRRALARPRHKEGGRWPDRSSNPHTRNGAGPSCADGSASAPCKDGPPDVHRLFAHVCLRSCWEFAASTLGTAERVHITRRGEPRVHLHFEQTSRAAFHPG